MSLTRGDGVSFPYGSEYGITLIAEGKDFPMSNALTSKGQVTIPKRIRETLGVGPGESVDFRLNDRGEMVIERAGAGKPVESRFARWRGAWKGGMTTDEIMALTRGEPD